MNEAEKKHWKGDKEMKKTISIPVTTVETREIRYINEAENAIVALRRLVSEMETGKYGGTMIANEKTLFEEKNPVRFMVRKTIDTEVIEGSLEIIDKLVEQLAGEVSKLETAIVTELTKELPQE